MIEFLKPVWVPLMKIFTTLIVALGIAVGGYFYGVTVTDHKYEVAAIQKKALDLTLINLTAQADAEQRALDARTIANLEKDVADARQRLRNQDNVCFDANDVDQLHEFWKP